MATRAEDLPVLRAQLAELEAARARWLAEKQTKQSFAQSLKQQVKQSEHQLAQLKKPTNQTTGKTRKEELQLLQERALAIVKKNQQTASALTKQFKQLNNLKRPSDAPLETTQLPKRTTRVESLPAAESIASHATTKTMHDCTGLYRKLTTEEHAFLKTSLLFRISVRYLLQTGKPIPATLLLEKAQQCTGGSCALGSEDIRHFAQTLSEYHCMGLVKGCADIELSIDQSKLRIWTPGSQVAAEPTLCLEEPALIKAWLMLEKQAIEDACSGPSSLGSIDSAGSLDTALRSSYFAASLMGKAPFQLASVDPTQAFPHCLARVFERSVWRSSATFQSLSEFSGFCLHLDKLFQSRISDDSLDLHSHSSAVHKATFANPTSSFSRPFAIGEDSIFKQVHSRSAGTKKSIAKDKQVDPMRIFCLFELNGTCNDENCAYLHQKDFEAATERSLPEDNGSEEVSQLLSAPELHLLQNFAERRALVMKKWPLIGLKSSIGKKASVAGEQGSASRNAAGHDEAMDDENFLALEDANDSICADSTRSVGSLRYCDGDQSMTRLSAESLEESVKTNTGDVNSWLLLAIIQLQLDVTCSDDVSQLSDESFVYHQLMSVWRFLGTDSSTTASIDENLLKRSLSTLSRALEHEENAYNEVLWLFHLQLSQVLGDLEGVLQTAEQAGLFIPRSHGLWLHYLSISHFDSIPTMEAMYGRILAHISKKYESMNESAEEEIMKASSLSILMTAVLVSLCVRLFRAGKSTRVLEILGSVINFHPASTSTTFVDARILDQRELACITMTYAHILLFNEIPAHMGTWAMSTVNQPPKVKQFAYTIESFGLNSAPGYAQDGDSTRSFERRKQALDVYESLIEQWNPNTSSFDTGNVLYTNWILVLSSSCEVDHANDDHLLHVLLEHHWPQIKLLPLAAFTAARVLDELVGHRTKAVEFMIAVVNTVDEKYISEALYYYLCLHQCSQAKDPCQDGDFVCHRSVWVQLTRLFGKIPGHLVEKATTIHEQTDPEEYRKFLDELIMIWMDRWRLVDGGTTPLKLSDIYLLLNVIQLLSLLIGPTGAIESLEPILRSSRLDFIPIEWRQIIWKMRFMLESSVIFQSLQRSLPHQTAISYTTGLMLLFRTYMDRMNVESEQKQKLKATVSKAVMRHDVEAALQECLSPFGRNSAIELAQMELFQMVVGAIPPSETSTLFSKFIEPLGHAPEFWLMFADFATQDWEFRKVRAGLRKCVADRSTTKMHARVLAALASLELRQGQMKALAATLERCIQDDPLVVGSWELLLGLEILCGYAASPSSDQRASQLADELSKLSLSVRVNAYGDNQVANALHRTAKNPMEAQIIFGKSTERLSLHQCELFRVPNAVLLCNQLRVLDLSANCLVELPSGMDRLKTLEVLNLSENSIANFPIVIARLGALKELDLSHNNLRTLPEVVLMKLVKLEILDLRANSIDEVPPSVIKALTSLRSLRLQDNMLPDEAIRMLEEGLPAPSVIEVLEDDDDEPMGLAVATEDSVESGSIEEGELRETIEVHEVEQNGATPNELQADGIIDSVAEKPADSAATSDTVMTTESIDESEDDEVEFVGFSRNQAARSDQLNLAAAKSSTSNDLQAAPNARADQIEVLERMKAYANETGMPLTQVRQCQPALWQEYVKAHVPTNMFLGGCVLCQRANDDGRNQRFNTMVLCPFCLQDAVDLLHPGQQRSQNLSPATESKEDA